MMGSDLNSGLLLLGIVFLLLNLQGAKKYFTKTEQEKIQKVQDNINLIRVYLGNEGAKKSVFCFALFWYSIYIGFYLLGLLVFKENQTLVLFSIAMTLIPIINFLLVVREIKTDFKKMNYGIMDYVSKPLDFVYVVFYLLHVSGAMGSGVRF